MAYREAPDEILDALAVVARDGRRGSPAVRRARETVREWPGLLEAVRRIWAEEAGKDEDGARQAVVRCAGSPEQRAWLRAAYACFNRARFGGRLPADVPVRFSRRMRSSLGHMRPGTDAGGQRRAVEIALNLDLVLKGNEDELVDTLLHEMAHAADWLFEGERGHGASWRRWAAGVGCAQRTRHHGGFRRRRRRGAAVTRVPPAPERLLERGGSDA